MIIRFRTNAIIDDVYYSTINDLNSLLILLIITDLPIIFYFANYLSHVVKNTSQFRPITFGETKWVA